MSERDNNIQGEKPKKKYSRLANAAAVCFYVGVFLYFAAAIIVEAKFLRKLGWLTLMVGCILLVGAAILSIAGIISIARSKGQLMGIGRCLGGILVLLILVGLIPTMLVPFYARKIEIEQCQCNLKRLGRVMRVYAQNNDGQYPLASQWCDLLLEYAKGGEELEHAPEGLKDLFVCYSYRTERCHYAMNPNCGSNSRGDIVLLFETKDGWNQFGGPELFTTENHGGEGGNVLFNDGDVQFVKAKYLGKLRWKDERA